MNKSKTFERYSECSSAVTIVSHPDEFRRSCLPLQRRRRHTTKIVYEEVTALYSWPRNGTVCKCRSFWGVCGPKDDRRRLLVRPACSKMYSRDSPARETNSRGEARRWDLSCRTGCSCKERNDCSFPHECHSQKGTEKSMLNMDARDDGDMATKDGKAMAGTSRLNANGIKKILIDTNKIRVGTSHQERMVIDLKKAATWVLQEGKRNLSRRTTWKRRGTNGRRSMIARVVWTLPQGERSVPVELQNGGDIDLHLIVLSTTSKKDKIDKENLAWT